MANTENIEAKLCAYVDGELDADGRAEIERHLVANPQHRRLLEELTRGRELLRALPREDAPDDLIDEIQGQLERSVLLEQPVDDEAAAVAGRINRWPHRLSAAAVVLLAVGLGAVIFYVLPRDHGTEYAGVTPGAPSAASRDGDAVRLDSSGDELAPMGGPGLFGGAAGAGRGAEESERLRAAAAPDGMAGLPPAGPSPTEPDAPAPDTSDLAMGVATPPSAAGGATPSNVFSDAFASKMPAGGAGGAAAADVRAVQDQLFNADLARQLKQSPGGLKDNAMFVVVSTNDAATTKDQVASYLVSNNIATASSITWRSVAEPMPAPLDIAESQTAMMSRQNRTQVHMKSGPPAAEQVAQQAPAPGEKAQAQSDAFLREEKAKSDGPAAASQNVAAAAGAAGPGQAPTREGDGPVQAKRPAAAPTAGAGAGGALADQQQNQNQQMQQRVPEDMEARGGATGQPQQSLQEPVQQQQQKLLQAEPYVRSGYADGRELIVARGMTRQQAAELQTTLTRQRYVQRAAVYGQAAGPQVSEYYAGAPARAESPGAADRGPDGALKKETFGGGAGSSTLPAVPANEPFAVMPTTDAAASRPIVVPGATADRSATAPAPLAEKPFDAAAVAPPPTTRPADAVALADAKHLGAEPPADEERVDVVIVVQDEPAAGEAGQDAPGTEGQATVPAPAAEPNMSNDPAPPPNAAADDTDAPAAAAPPPPATTQPAAGPDNAKAAGRP